MIGELIERFEATKPKPPPDDLLNSDPPCECGVCGCNSPLIEPKRFRA